MNRWFRFYFIFKQAFEEVSIFETKKLLFAVIEYQEKGMTDIKLSKKTNELFMAIKSIYEAEKEFYRKNGSKGSKNRWVKKKNNQKIGRVSQNYREPIKKNGEPIKNYREPINTKGGDNELKDIK